MEDKIDFEKFFKTVFFAHSYSPTYLIHFESFYVECLSLFMRVPTHTSLLILVYVTIIFQVLFF